MTNHLNTKKKFIVFSDSYFGIKRLLKINNYDILKVKTFSPYVLTKFKNNNKVVCPLNKKKIQKLNLLKKSYSDRIFSFLRKRKLKNLSNYATYQFCRMEPLFAKAISLENEDFKNNVIIQKVKGSKNDSVFNTKIDKFLNLQKLKIINYYYKDNYNYNLNETRFDNLKVQSFKTLFYYILKRLSFLNSILGYKGKIFLLHETFFIRETVMSLFKYGYSFKVIRPLTVKKKDLALNDINIPGLKKIFFQFLNKLLGSQKEKKECKNFLYREFIQYISYHLAYQTVWREFILNQKKKPKAIMSGYPKNYIYTSLREASSEFNIPIITYQHAVTPEIINECFIEHNKSVTDSCFSDYFFCFNKASKKYYENKYSVAKCIPTGLPQEISNQVICPFTKKRSKHLTYVSSNLYAGNVNSVVQKGIIDYDIAKEEIELFDKVFSKLSHKIYFQSYPKAPRYIDPDPIIEFLKKIKNTEILDKNKDLKFLRTQPTIFVSKNMTSSIGYLLLSGRPIIFLNYMSQFIRKELRNKFKEILFFFDEKEKNFFQNVKNFLKQPLELIDNEWEKKRKKRKKFISNYLGSNDGKAGERAAKLINQYTILNNNLVN